MKRKERKRGEQSLKRKESMKNRISSKIKLLSRTVPSSCAETKRRDNKCSVQL